MADTGAGTLAANAFHQTPAGGTLLVIIGILIVLRVIAGKFDL